MSDSLDARVGRNLRAFRRDAKLDVDALARRTGLHAGAIGLYESGRLRVPVEVLTLLSRVLARPLDAFFA